MPERRFSVGERVMARWPASSLFFEGEVEDFNDIEYLVRFDDNDDTKLAIKYKDVQPVASFRSTRSHSRGRSPGRANKSPARAKTSTSKSPGRGRPLGSKSPGRKPKAETKANVSSTSSQGSQSPSDRSTITTSSSKANSSSSSSSSSLLLSSLNAKPEHKTPVTPTRLRASVRIATLEKVNDDDQKSITTTTTTTTTTSSSSNISSLRGRGREQSYLGRCSLTALSWLAALCNIVFPALKALPGIAFIVAVPMLMTQACSKKKCTILEMPDLPTKLENYYDIRAVGLVAALLAVQSVLAFVPVRTKVLPNGAKARGNAIITLVLLCLAIPASMYLKQNVQILYTLIRQLLATHVVLAVLLSLLLYAKSFYAPRSQMNSRATGHFLPDLVEGREVSARIGSVDITTFLVRYTCIYVVLFNIIVLLRDAQFSKGVYNPVLILACALQIIYVVSLLWFEDNIHTTWQYTHQGTGLLTLAMFLSAPFFNAVNVRLIMNHRPHLPWYCLTTISLVFLFGFLLERLANNQKHAFRTNPSSPYLSQLESIPTSAGTRLIVSGWWGVVRHPNLVGSFIVQLAMAMLTGFNFGLPWLCLGLSTLTLLARMYQRERSCRDKYGLSWTTYTSRVKYRLIPRVF